jgi:outer membrane receptor protein involved in Fe transport
VAQSRADQYEVPNAPGDTVDDVQREADTFAVLSWVHTFPAHAVLTSSLLYHYNRANYDGGPEDDPISTTDQRSSTYEGAQEDLRMTVNRNHIDVGVFGFAQQDDEFFRLLFNDGGASPLAEAMQPSGGLAAAFLQDTFQATHWLSLSAGVRQTHFRGNVTENATDPRLGMTVVLPRLDWVLTASWGKYYQAPPLETLAGPLAEFATSSDTGFLPLRGERDTERQFGLTIPLRGWSIEADYFVNEARNFFDHDAIGNSDVFLPLTVQGARIKAYELTVRSPPFWRYGEAHLAFSNQTADGLGGITGGLTDFEPGAGSFALDHDQRNTLNAGLDANLPRRIFASVNLYYGSGFANGDAPPSHLPGHAELDLAAGRMLSRDLSLSITALNLTNRRLLTDNSLTFGGVHWNYPLQVYAELRYRFHY